ncbi:MAG: hypothetical protein ABSG04_14260 [Verrucomicrobiota bacterium]|jgi:hypothetical protein
MKTSGLSMIWWMAVAGWQPHWDNPDWRGWTVVAAYVVAAACCGRAALARGKMGPEERPSSVIWRVLAAGLLFLGINKQLDLQTLVIDLGRQAALAGGWIGEKRRVQLAVCAVLALTVVAAFWFVLARFRVFFVRNRWALAGVTVLLLFILIRAASVNHVLERMNIRYEDKKWTWVLEVGGSGCLALAATKAGKQTGNG